MSASQVDRDAAITDYVAAYQAANGKPITRDYLPLTYERGWVLFRDREPPNRIVARHRRGELWRMARRLRDAAGIPAYVNPPDARPLNPLHPGPAAGEGALDTPITPAPARR